MHSLVMHSLVMHVMHVMRAPPSPRPRPSARPLVFLLDRAPTTAAARMPSSPTSAQPARLGWPHSSMARLAAAVSGVARRGRSRRGGQQQRRGGHPHRGARGGEAAGGCRHPLAAQQGRADACGAAAVLPCRRERLWQAVQQPHRAPHSARQAVATHTGGTMALPGRRSRHHSNQQPSNSNRICAAASRVDA
jgi:hypothetical protein